MKDSFPKTHCDLATVCDRSWQSFPEKRDPVHVMWGHLGGYGSDIFILIRVHLLSCVLEEKRTRTSGDHLVDFLLRMKPE